MVSLMTLSRKVYPVLDQVACSAEEEMGRVKGLLFLLSPIFHCHKIKDGRYNNITNTNKVSPTQNMPALQAIDKEIFVLFFVLI